MNIGEMTRNDNGSVTGYIAESTFDFDNVFFEKVMSAHPRAPLFNLMTKSPRGRDVRLGSVWERAARETGEVYFSGYIDTAHTGYVPIRLFQSRDNATVWTVARHVPHRRRRPEHNAIDLPEDGSARDEAETPARKRARRQAPASEPLAA